MREHGMVQHLPAGLDGHGNNEPNGASGDRGSLERRGPGVLTREEVLARRRNRRWLTLILLPSLVVGGIALAAALIATSSSPVVRPVDIPPGYKAFNDGYFGYAIPKSWSQDPADTDNAGDQGMQGTAGWVAERLVLSAHAPGPDASPPPSFASFGEDQAVPYKLGAASSVHVAGATVAYRYVMTRPGGFQATAIHAWSNNSGGDLWLLIHSDRATTAAVEGSLRAG